jgi:hypothetical protein
MTLSALGFAALVWGSLALVAGILLYELATLWREHRRNRAA